MNNVILYELNFFLALQHEYVRFGVIEELLEALNISFTRIRIPYEILFSYISRVIPMYMDLKQL